MQSQISPCCFLPPPAYLVLLWQLRAPTGMEQLLPILAFMLHNPHISVPLSLSRVVGFGSSFDQG